MAGVKIQVLDNGPFLINGEVEIVDGQGFTIENKDQCSLCRCGFSSTQPYCSGAHQGKYYNELRSWQFTNLNLWNYFHGAPSPVNITLLPIL